MKYRVINQNDLEKYGDDIFDAYSSNHLIFDTQNIFADGSKDVYINYLEGYVHGIDSYVLGFFDNNEEYLYGVAIVDNIRTVDITTAEVHIAVNKKMWGSSLLHILEEAVKYVPVDIFYCQIPQIAVRALGLVKRLGFKKTGYIPKALPYKNIKGEEKLYDINILVLDKTKIRKDV